MTRLLSGFHPLNAAKLKLISAVVTSPARGYRAFGPGGLADGPDGSRGSEYRTELDSLTKVVAQGFLGSGPQWFEVWTKAGQRLEYGRTDDARVTLGERADLLTWAANRIEDSLGNAMTIHYQATGEQYPLAIRYAGNRVRFDYEDRPDSLSGYRLGSAIHMTRRLSAVTVEAQGDRVRAYRLKYHPTDNLTPSRLSSVALCASADSADDDCLLPVTFNWRALDASGRALTQREINYRDRTDSYPRTRRATTGAFQSNTWNRDDPRELGDFDGDGFLDIVGFQASGIQFGMGNGDGDFGYNQGWRVQRPAFCLVMPSSSPISSWVMPLPTRRTMSERSASRTDAERDFDNLPSFITSSSDRTIFTATRTKNPH